MCEIQFCPIFISHRMSKIASDWPESGFEKMNRRGYSKIYQNEKLHTTPFNFPIPDIEKQSHNFSILSGFVIENEPNYGSS